MVEASDSTESGNGSVAPIALQVEQVSKRITVEEIGRELAVSVPTVYAMLKGRKIPNIRQGKLYIVSREAFTRWLATCGTGPEALQ
jgi:excisionase family DNA binding protein